MSTDSAVLDGISWQTYNQLRDELMRAAEGERPCVVVDLTRVTFIDSTGLGVLVGAFKRVRECGALSLVCPQRSVRRVLEITGLTQVFPLFNTLEEAVASCSKTPVAEPSGAESSAAQRPAVERPAPRAGAGQAGGSHG